MEPSGSILQKALRSLDALGLKRLPFGNDFKAAREKEIVSRFLPAQSHSQVIKAHILAMNYCDGSKAALKNLKQIAEGVESKAKDKEEGQRIAKAYLHAMPWAH